MSPEASSQALAYPLVLSQSPATNLPSPQQLHLCNCLGPWAGRSAAEDSLKIPRAGGLQGPLHHPNNCSVWLPHVTGSSLPPEAAVSPGDSSAEEPLPGASL